MSNLDHVISESAETAVMRHEATAKKFRESRTAPHGFSGESILSGGIRGFLHVSAADWTKVRFAAADALFE
ncbi:hypothetical protein [Paraburkholderia sp.]|uniref:hypothetical protein n=1 Tax=Paraburkholderia sp. TaxID=1926495 RepID=UPI002396542F|nr:hypothetical protein [Paraburkholderia sp.]MDE1182342.1 hypothetical protein [Paraburkholderia sp.]